ncbi:hypothetical protein HGP14_28145 [Rhizobium sp. P32RR-XVIII]|nr:hypothetical protein [Rhizobium sp. P32RR-XVIII]NLS07172.1 hypothetical protein [Rhizobium sp. P32RR-XVIII]
MTTPAIPQRNARPSRRDPAAHIFAVGQFVQLKGRFRIFPSTSTDTPRGNMLQYRIRNEDERHERVTTEDTLEPVRSSPDGADATLMKRTFGHG